MIKIFFPSFHRFLFFVYFQVNEITQIVTMEVSIRMFWYDPRVKVNNFSMFEAEEEYVTLNPRLARHLWIPDLFIDQAKELREPTFHVLPASLRVYRQASKPPNLVYLALAN